jgi:hypothetical protein
MNCCDEAGNCTQDKNCPVRTCRQRAGKPADYNSPVWLARQQEELDAELERQWKRDLKSIVFIASCMVTFAIIVLVTA